MIYNLDYLTEKICGGAQCEKSPVIDNGEKKNTFWQASACINIARLQEHRAECETARNVEVSALLIAVLLLDRGDMHDLIKYNQKLIL